MSATDDPNVKKVLDCLNEARRMEIGAIHQYMIQHYALGEMDYGKLCAYQKLIAIDEMNHAEDFAERVDELGGLPVCDMSGSIVQPQTVEQMYPYDIGLEAGTIEKYDSFAKICHECKDSISASLFSKIIEQERVHLSYYEEMKDHLEKLGNAFLARFALTSKKSGPIKSFVKVWEEEKF